MKAFGEEEMSMGPVSCRSWTDAGGWLMESALALAMLVSPQHMTPRRQGFSGSAERSPWKIRGTVFLLFGVMCISEDTFPFVFTKKAQFVMGK